MIKSTDGLKGIISGWTSLGLSWNDKKSKYIEDNIINVLESAINEFEMKMDEITEMACKTEEKIDEIERTGDGYGW